MEEGSSAMIFLSMHARGKVQARTRKLFRGNLYRRAVRFLEMQKIYSGTGFLLERREKGMRTEEKKSYSPFPPLSPSRPHHEIRLLLQRALRLIASLPAQAHFQILGHVGHARAVGLVAPGGRCVGGVAGPDALFADGARRGSALRGEFAAVEEVEGAEDGRVGAEDADVHFGAGKGLVWGWGLSEGDLTVASRRRLWKPLGLFSLGWVSEEISAPTYMLGLGLWRSRIERCELYSRRQCWFLSVRRDCSGMLYAHDAHPHQKAQSYFDP